MYLSGEHERLFVDALLEHCRCLLRHVLLHHLVAMERKEPANNDPDSTIAIAMAVSYAVKTSRVKY